MTFNCKLGSQYNDRESAIDRCKLTHCCASRPTTFWSWLTKNYYARQEHEEKLQEFVICAGRGKYKIGDVLPFHKRSSGRLDSKSDIFVEALLKNKTSAFDDKIVETEVWRVLRKARRPWRFGFYKLWWARAFNAICRVLFQTYLDAEEWYFPDK